MGTLIDFSKIKGKRTRVVLNYFHLVIREDVRMAIENGMFYASRNVGRKTILELMQLSEYQPPPDLWWRRDLMQVRTYRALKKWGCIDLSREAEKE